MITSEIIADSIGPNSPRLTTMLAKYPKFIHSEHLRHRSFSFSVSSSRAIPVSKNLEEVRNDELRAAPVWWGREQKGMASGDELPNIKNPDDVTSEFYRHGRTELETAQNLWKIAAHYAESCADRMRQIGAHKSIVNRILEPFLHVNVLVTGTHDGWMNFFGLRLDSYAQPEIRTLAEVQWRCWNEHQPTLLQPGEWHLPFVDEQYRNEIREYNRFLDIDNSEGFDKAGILSISKEVSVACSAHLSYVSFETGKRMGLEQCINLHNRLVKSVPIHASPAEHQATPDTWYDPHLYNPRSFDAGWWENPKLHGNLPGWIQYRKTLPGEAIAPLPKEYTE